MARSGSRGLAFCHWPEADLRLWHRLTTSGDPLDEAGALSHLRATSLETMRNAYGFFLGHLRRIGQDLDHGEPHERISRGTLQSYLESLEGLSPRTKAGYFAELLKMIKAGYPDQDWPLLKAAAWNLQYIAQKAGGTRDKSGIPHAAVLLKLGIDIENRGRSKNSDRDRAEGIRDGLMVQFLIQYPLRVKNFSELDIGSTLRLRGDRFTLNFPGSEVKNHRPLTITLSREMSDKLDAYIKDTRPLFPGGEDPSSGRLWLRFTYGPWKKMAIGKHISRLTSNSIGKRITPHMFRDSAATTIAISENTDARTIRPLLGHSHAATSERYYIQARQIEASKMLHKAQKAILDQLS